MAMRKAMCLAALAVVGLSFGCATMNITSDYDPKASFSSLKTYAWLPDPEGQSTDLKRVNPLMDEYVRNEIEKVLAAKGYTKGASPDFQVGYHVSVVGRQSVQYMNTYYGYAPGWYSPGMTATVPQVYEYNEGTLVIDIVDPAARKLIWRGSAQAELNRNPSTEEKKRKVDTAVEKIFQQFPPKPK
jgi:hypothetical protein